MTAVAEGSLTPMSPLGSASRRRGPRAGEHDVADAHEAAWGRRCACTLADPRKNSLPSMVRRRQHGSGDDARPLLEALTEDVEEAEEDDDDDDESTAPSARSPQKKAAPPAVARRAAVGRKASFSAVDDIIRPTLAAVVD